MPHSSQKFSSASRTRGVTLVEVVIGCAIIATMIFAVMLAAQKGITLSQTALRRTQANLLLEEGAEAVKSIRDGAWSNISGLTVGSTYYLTYNTGTNVWSLGTTPVSATDSIFTRTVVLAAVTRDASDDIAASGTTDTRTKKVTVTVSWTNSLGATASSTLSFYIADIFT